MAQAPCHASTPALGIESGDVRRSAVACHIRAQLASKGTPGPVGPYNILIAGEARARELTLVTSERGERGLLFPTPAGG